jgi:hypothetical protein
VNTKFLINSTDSSFNCSTFDADNRTSIIKGPYFCHGTHQVISNPTNASPTSTPTPSSTSKPKLTLSKGGMAGIVISALTMPIALFTTALLIIKKRREQVTRKSSEASEFEFVGSDEKHEMDSEQILRRELATGKERHELAEDHGRAEAVGDETHAFEMPG